MENRRTGRTTRLIDAAVQELFTTGRTVLEDNHPHLSMTLYKDTLLKRLKSEHRLTMENGLHIEGKILIMNNFFTIK